MFIDMFMYVCKVSSYKIRDLQGRGGQERAGDPAGADASGLGGPTGEAGHGRHPGRHHHPVQHWRHRNQGHLLSSFQRIVIQSSFKIHHFSSILINFHQLLPKTKAFEGLFSERRTRVLSSLMVKLSLVPLDGR